MANDNQKKTNGGVLTPKEYGEMFGVSPKAVRRVLRAAGLSAEQFSNRKVYVVNPGSKTDKAITELLDSVFNGVGSINDDIEIPTKQKNTSSKKTTTENK